MIAKIPSGHSLTLQLFLQIRVAGSGCNPRCVGTGEYLVREGKVTQISEYWTGRPGALRLCHGQPGSQPLHGQACFNRDMPFLEQAIAPSRLIRTRYADYLEVEGVSKFTNEGKARLRSATIDDDRVGVAVVFPGRLPRRERGNAAGEGRRYSWCPMHPVDCTECSTDECRATHRAYGSLDVTGSNDTRLVECRDRFFHATAYHRCRTGGCRRPQGW